MHAILLGVLFAATPADDAAALDAYLARCEGNYSAAEQMLGQSFKSPGYHTKVADGTWVHTTRGSLDYALALLTRNRPGDADRAGRVIAKVLTLQDTNPQSRTCGIWPWLREEPLDKMAAPDFNWADFCGASLAQMLHDHGDKLPAALQADMRRSLRLAAEAIRRRNVGPDYTNIAIMGGGVCAAAGELLDDNALLRYGRERLEREVKHTAYHGGFNEYNSPTYTIVALNESERVLHLVRDAAARAAAESLRQTAWQTIAESFHPGTQQWAGPHARAYSDYLFSQTVAYLGRQTGVALRPHPSFATAPPVFVPMYNALPCPEKWRSRFAALPCDPVELKRTFIRREPPAVSIVGTTWLTAEACLGSVSEATFWTQHHPLIAYWQTPDDPAVVFRVRFLHDGRDFCSMGCRIAQAGARALLIAYPLAGQGDWHPGLDRPKDGCFMAGDFRLRCELHGKGVSGGPLGDGRFRLAAGNWQAVIHALPGKFAGQEVRWESACQADAADVDALCYQGDRKRFDFRVLPETLLAVGVELLPKDQPPTAAQPIAAHSAAGGIEARWPVGAGNELTVRK